MYRTALRTLHKSFKPTHTASLHTSTLSHQQAQQQQSSKPAPPPGYIRVTVDSNEIDIPNGYTVLQACESAGVVIPRFCYHDRLSVAGNCRMCLVEVEKSPKPVASCAMPAMPNMKIKTYTPLVQKAREGVMEFLLQNHPLDCPICDQGGECDLQDESVAYGSDRSRFKEVKRTVEDKNLGPLVKTVMTRCIHCTRCVRYATEIAGIPLLGTTGRGQQMEIGTYVEKPLDSEISGNIIDLCPVGALTSKPYAFTARPWELTKTESIDVLDGVGSNIRIDTRGPEVMRILPRLNEEVNEEWISDKTRFSYDGLKRQRLDVPLIRNNNNEYIPSTWPESLNIIAQNLNAVDGSEVYGVVGELADSEAIIALKDLLNKKGSTNMHHQHYNTVLNTDLRTDYIFNSTIQGIEQADAVLLINSNPRMEAAVLSARLRKSVRQYEQAIYSIGPECDLAMRHTHLGNNTQILQDIASEKHEVFKRLQSAKHPLILIGEGALQGDSLSSGVYSAVAALKSKLQNLVTDKWNGINVLHTTSSYVSAADLGFVPGKNAFSKKQKFVYLVGAEAYNQKHVADNAFIVYQGHHGDMGASVANIILPATAYTEKYGTYVNTEGRIQRTTAANGRLANARDDWQIIRAVAEIANLPLPYSSSEEIYERLVEVCPTYAHIDTTPESSTVHKLSYHTDLYNTKLPSQPFTELIQNYFFTNSISRNSRIMAQASQTFPNARNSYTSHRHSTDLKDMKPDTAQNKRMHA